MGLQVIRRLGAADVVTVLNGVVGFVAGALAFTVPALAARLILLAAIVDALDGIIARHAGNSQVGPLLDSITDVVSFGTTPGLFLFGVGVATWGEVGTLSRPLAAAVLLVPAGFAVLSIVRTAFYEVYVEGTQNRPGIPNALAAVILAAAYLTGVVSTPVLFVAGAVLAVLMVAPVRYPKLAVRDALVLGTVQAGAIVAPDVLDHALPFGLLVAALAYLTLAPRFYWADPATT